MPGMSLANFKGQTLTGKIIDDRYESQSATIEQLVGREVYRPTLSHMTGRRVIRSNSTALVPSGRLRPHGQILRNCPGNPVFNSVTEAGTMLP